jgi:hypothetical protein
MRVEEKSFCTPRDHGRWGEVKDYLPLASTLDEARCQQHKYTAF